MFNGVKHNEVSTVLLDKVKEGNGDAILFVVFGLWSLIFAGIELIYIIFAIQYADITVWVAYLAFWIFVLFYGIVKGKIASIRNKTIEKADKYSIRLLVFYIVDLIFFVYMIFKLFI